MPHTLISPTFSWDCPFKWDGRSDFSGLIDTANVATPQNGCPANFEEKKFDQAGKTI
jgi:hypothetical protein